MSSRRAKGPAQGAAARIVEVVRERTIRSLADMFDGPAAPFAEGVIRPAPAVLFKKGDAIRQILSRPFSPRDRREFADVDDRIVPQLEIAHRLKRPPQKVLVPPLRRVGIALRLPGAAPTP